MGTLFALSPGCSVSFVLGWAVRHSEWVPDICHLGQMLLLFLFFSSH